MIFSCEEMNTLRFTAWCKDVPSSVCCQESFRQLIDSDCLRVSKSGLSIRVTTFGSSILERAGYSIAQDKQYLGTSKTLDRRIMVAEIMLLLRTIGTDVFIENPTQYRDGLSFLPSFAMRREKGTNILGGTRMTGFLYTPQNLYIPYYIKDGNEGLYPHTEQAIFKGEYFSKQKPPIVIYMGKSELSELFETVYHKEQIEFKTKAVTYASAAEYFNAPVCFIPLSEEGARQLRIICQKDYRTRLVRAILGKNFELTGYEWCDAIHKKTKAAFLCGINMNLKGLNRTLELINGALLHITVLDFQVEFLREYLKGKNVMLYPIKISEAEKVLGLPEILRKPNYMPYQTKEGEYINVTDIKMDRKIRK